MRICIISLVFLCFGFSELEAQANRSSSSSVQAPYGLQSMVTAPRINHPENASGNRGLSHELSAEDIDAHLIYHLPHWQDAVIMLQTGEQLDAVARYRIIDQKVEVFYEGEAYELDNSGVKSMSLGEHQFVFLPDLLNNRSSRVIYQLHYQDSQQQLLEHHSVDYQQNANDNLFDASHSAEDAVRRRSVVLYGRGGVFTPLSSKKTLVRLLDIPRSGDIADFIRHQHLQLKHAEDAARLLQFLADYADNG